MSKYKVAWSKTYHTSGEVEIEAVSEAHAVQKVLEDEMGGYEGSMQYEKSEEIIDTIQRKNNGMQKEKSRALKFTKMI